MPQIRRPRRGSLQFYPRKRAAKLLPSVNWSPVVSKVSDKEQGLLGFIAYKAAMSTVLLKDATPKVQSSGKQVATPATILEVPNMKIFSVRFYKNNSIIKDVVVSNDKELKRKLRVPKSLNPFDSQIPSDHDDIHLIIYSIPKQTEIKKTPDLVEVAIKAQDKLGYVKSILNKDLSLEDFVKVELLDVRGVTIGRGLSGTVKRFGIGLKQHKSEKGVRRPGSLGPWHPARVTFRAPMAGQVGLFTRVIYNLRLLSKGKISEKNINPSGGFKNYGEIKTSYIIIKGSVQGPVKRPVVITPAFRPTKLQSKEKLEFIEVIN